MASIAPNTITAVRDGFKAAEKGQKGRKAKEQALEERPLNAVWRLYSTSGMTYTEGRERSRKPVRIGEKDKVSPRSPDTCAHNRMREVGIRGYINERTEDSQVDTA